MRRFFVLLPAGLACFVIAFVPALTAGAAADPVVTMPADCGGTAFCFTPPTLTITDGDTVTWSNQSGTEHIVSRCAPADCDGVGGGTGNDAGFTSGDVASGSTYAHTFQGPGTYTYYCAIHGYAAMHGVIVVNAAPPPTTSATTATTTATRRRPARHRPLHRPLSRRHRPRPRRRARAEPAAGPTGAHRQLDREHARRRARGVGARSGGLGCLHQETRRGAPIVAVAHSG